MPRIEIFQNKQTKEIVLCSFAHCVELGGGDMAMGPLIHMPLDTFINNAAQIVTDEFDKHYQRDSSARSELYEVMTNLERRKFFSEHAMIGVSWPIKSGPVKICLGEEYEVFDNVNYPPDPVSFRECILRALSQRRKQM